jgi:SDR family mycofactocin-dependent oxidoreductase
MGRLDGKVALVTGAARGQGRSHALTMAREGADILAFDLATEVEHVPYPLATTEELEATVADVEALDRRIIAVQGDVRKQEDLDGLVERGIAEFGQIDIVVANAGLWSPGFMWEQSEAAWKTVIDITLNGAWRTVKAVAPHLIERQQGSVILISSVNGHEGGVQFPSYVAAKHGVTGIMRCAALELGPHGIRVNEVCPGVVDTAIVDNQFFYDLVAGGEGLGTRKAFEEAGPAWTLLRGRGLLKPQATSNAVLWLASDESSEVTGLSLYVDAGHNVMPGMDPAVISEIAVVNAQKSGTV